MKDEPLSWDETHLKMAMDLARAYTYRRQRPEMLHIDWEAVHSAARFGALEALKSYRPTHGTRITTWIVSKVKSAIIEEMRSQDYLSRHVREKLKNNRGVDEDDPPWALVPTSIHILCPGAETDYTETIEDLAPCPEAVVLLEAHKEWVRSLLKYLPPRHRQFIELRFFQGRKFREVAAILGTTEGNLCVIRREALARLRHVLEQLGIDSNGND